MQVCNSEHIKYVTSKFIQCCESCFNIDSTKCLQGMVSYSANFYHLILFLSHTREQSGSQVHLIISLQAILVMCPLCVCGGGRGFTAHGYYNDFKASHWYMYKSEIKGNTLDNPESRRT